MPLKSNTAQQSHRQLRSSSPGVATALVSRGPTLNAAVMQTACYTKQPVNKEDVVLEKAGVGDRKLALKLDRIDRESKAHMKMREREEKAMRQMCKDIRKHRVFDDSAVGRKGGGAGGGNRLLPPITTPESSPRNIRRVRSTPNSPTGKRKTCFSATPARTPTSSSDSLAIPDSDQDKLGLRVMSAGPGLSPVVLHRRSRSISNLPGPAGIAQGSHGNPAITFYACKDDRRQHSNPDVSRFSVPTPPPSSCSTPTKQRPWERGLTPARRARSPGELVKAQGVSYLTASQSGLRPSKSEGNLTGAGIEKCSEDPRFQKLASCLVPNERGRCSRSDENLENQDSAGSSSLDSLNQEMVAIRITSSTPTLPSREPKPFTHPLPGHLKEPHGDSLPPLKAHNPRASSPRILINSTDVPSAGQQEAGAISEETIDLNSDIAGSGAGPGRGFVIQDSGRLDPGDTARVMSPPFYNKHSIPDW